MNKILVVDKGYKTDIVSGTKNSTDWPWVTTTTSRKGKGRLDTTRVVGKEKNRPDKKKSTNDNVIVSARRTTI